MRFHTLTFSAILLAISGVSFASNPSPSDCVSFTEATQHVGAIQCIRGTVQHVENGSNGVTILNFCTEAKACPFTAVVFPGDLKKIGDVRLLEGRTVEIKGMIENYDGRAEIVVRRSQQLGQAAFLVRPPVPTEYDVERAGHHSAGKFRLHKSKKTHPKKQGRPVSIEDPEEPE